MFPPYCKSPREFLRDYTYHDLRVYGVEHRDRIAARERAERHGIVY